MPTGRRWRSRWAPAEQGVYGYMMNNNVRMMAIVGSRATHAVLQRSAHRRRAGAQGAAAERRREVGRRCRDAAHRAGRRHQSGERPAADLRRDRGVRQGAVAAAGGRRQGAESPQGLAADRQGRAAPRHGGRRSTAPPVRHRHHVAGDGLRHHAALAGAQFGAGELERRRRSRRCRASIGTVRLPTASRSWPIASSAHWRRAMRSR